MATEEEGWSSLPAELVNLVADRFLATNDLDYYMNLRAVCHGWRSATADPWSNQQHDPRFRPTRWLMLKEEGHAAESSASSSSSHLFFNVTNGRIVRMSRLPQLIRDYMLISATACGLLVLAARDCPHAVRVLNPFTSSWSSFKVRVPPGTLPPNHSTSAAMVGSSPTLVLAISNVAWSPSHSVTVYWADRQSKSFSVETRKGCSPTMLPLIAAGKCAATAVNGGPCPSSSSADASATTINIFNLLSTKNYLCDTVGLADGDILAVLTRLSPTDDHAAVVFTTDSAGNVMERVNSIGSYALFLGSSRCLAVDAEVFPAHTIEENCIYNNFLADWCRVYKFETRREHAEQAQWWIPLRFHELPHPILRRLSESIHHRPDYPQQCSGWRCYFLEKGRATKLLKRAVAVIVVVLIVVAIVKSGSGGGADGDLYL